MTVLLQNKYDDDFKKLKQIFILIIVQHLKLKIE